MNKMPPGVITIADRIHTRAALVRVLLALCPVLVLAVVPLGSGSWLALGSVPSSIEVDGRILIDDFEDVSDWSGLDLEMDITHNGVASGRRPMRGPLASRRSTTCHPGPCPPRAASGACGTSAPTTACACATRARTATSARWTAKSIPAGRTSRSSRGDRQSSPLRRGHITGDGGRRRR